jgi:EAL domain-containing protein (putative c-di-GMP-specific phosphodiesterase class I)
VRSVLGLGRALNLPIVAEGVETAAELDFLERELCSEAQGYLLGRPANIEGFRQLTHGIDVPDERSIVVQFVPKASSV